MSIIYDALKKIENSQKKTGAKLGNLLSEKAKLEKPKEKKNYLFYFIFIVMVIFGFMFSKLAFKLFLPRMPTLTQTRPNINLYQPPVIKTSPQDTLLPETRAPEEEVTLDFILNGIFSDSENSYAIINNRVVREGDSLSGAKVLNILPEKVELEVQGGRLTLKIKN